MADDELLLDDSDADSSSVDAAEPLEPQPPAAVTPAWPPWLNLTGVIRVTALVSLCGCLFWTSHLSPASQRLRPLSLRHYAPQTALGATAPRPVTSEDVTPSVTVPQTPQPTLAPTPAPTPAPTTPPPTASPTAPPTIPTCVPASRPVDPGCPRYAHWAITVNEGLGNKFQDYLWGHLFARALNATYLYVPTPWSQGTQHGTYEWVEGMLNLGGGEGVVASSKDEAMQRLGLSEVQVPAFPVNGWAPVPAGCNTLFIGNCFTCGAEDPSTSMWVKYCGKFFRGSFDSAKDEVRCKVAASNYSAPLIYPPPDQTGAYVVAWHLRVGDITIPRDKAYFQAVIAILQEVLEGYDVHHYFFAEDEQHPHTPPDAFAFLAEPGLFGVQANVTFVGTMRPEPTVYHLMNADALVTTGSSFPIVAAVASWKPLLFLGRPKEGPYGVHALCDSVLLDDKGGLAEDSIAAVRTRAQAKYRQFHAGRVPPAGSSFSWTDVNSAALCPIDEVVAV